MSLKHTFELVKSLLIKYQELRDSDIRLIFTVWNKELKDLGLQTEQQREVFKQLAKLIEGGQLSPAETIRRSRQELQKNDCTLWGEKYEIRQQQKVLFKEELKQLK